jgi:hypothetical protein
VLPLTRRGLGGGRVAEGEGGIERAVGAELGLEQLDVVLDVAAGGRLEGEGAAVGELVRAEKVAMRTAVRSVWLLAMIEFRCQRD